MTSNLKFYLVPAVVILILGCGGGGSDDSAGSSAADNLGGSWSGTAEVKIDSGAPQCSFFSGEYPINWSLDPIDAATFSVSSDGFEIATAAAVSDSEAVAEFTEVHNVLSDTGDSCHGQETVTMTAQPSGTLHWDYSGSADCGASGLCVYSGAGELEKQGG